MAESNIRKIAVIIVAAACIFAAFLITHKERVIDRVQKVEKIISPALANNNVKPDQITRQFTEERIKDGNKYVYGYREYLVPQSVSTKNVMDEIERLFKKGKFRIVKSDRKTIGSRESNLVEIGFGKYIVYSMRINKKRSQEAVVTPVIVRKKVSNPRVAIVIDDFGYTMSNIDDLLSINQPMTFSILPNLRYSKEVAEAAALKGYEVILHLPMESHRQDVSQEIDTITAVMGKKDILARLNKDISSVPGIKGVSNHMGSKATESVPTMDVILKDLHKRNLYFFDSLTSEKSVGREVAEKVGIKFAARDLFLDNQEEENYIKGRLDDLARFAFSKGRAIAICHDRKVTVKVLKEAMPKMAKEGIRFVYLSEMVN